VEYGECATFQPFIANKTFFHIEYPTSEAKFTQNQLCGIGDVTLDGFSLKNMDLDDLVTECSHA
jgi:hypothetical protein